MDNILQVHAVYKGGQLTALAVVWESSSDFKWARATFIENKPKGGYAWIKPGAKLTEELIQEAADYGAECGPLMRKAFFPGNPSDTGHKWE